MRAFLLAGGLGTRLRPITATLPKCLVPVGDRPLLDYWLDLCRREGITDVLVNVSQFPDLVARHLATRPSSPRVTLVAESRPMGNAGTVRQQRAFVNGEESFWVFYADNLTDCPLGAVRAFHATHDGLVTLGLFEAPDPRAAGIVELDARGRIVSLIEKPAHPRGTLANAGIYLARAGLIDEIPGDGDVVDFGFDVFPRLQGRMFGRRLDGFLIDVGTPAALTRARDEWARRHGAQRP